MQIYYILCSASNKYFEQSTVGVRFGTQIKICTQYELGAIRTTEAYLNGQLSIIFPLQLRLKKMYVTLRMPSKYPNNKLA